MDVIATQGGGMFLLSEREVSPEDENPPGVLVNLDSGLAISMPVQQALKWGYWRDPGQLGAATKKSLDIAAGTPITMLQYQQALEKEDARQKEYRNRHTILRDRKKVGTLVFGGVPAIEITSRDEPLLELIAEAMVNPIVVDDGEGGTIYSTLGDVQYEIAVLQLVENAGFGVRGE